MNILQSIFSDYYEQMIYELHPRPTVIENVDKMIHCGDPSFGGAMYGCPDCGKLKFVPFRCKSRFCPSCGNKYNESRSLHMSCKLIACTHRHCVFTIPEELRPYFLNDRSLLDCLFHAVRDVILRMFYKEIKEKRWHFYHLLQFVISSVRPSALKSPGLFFHAHFSEPYYTSNIPL